MKGIKIWMTGCLLSVMLAQVGTAAATKTEMQEAPVMETQDESYRVLPEAGPVPVGRFAYGQSRHGVNSLATSSIPAETEERETEAQETVACEDDLKNASGCGAPGWIEFERPPIMPYYANFDKQELSASVVNGSTLRISLDIDVEDDSGGDNGRCLYQLGPDGTINTYTGQLKFPWLEMQSQVRAFKGEIVTESFHSVQTSSNQGRRLTFKGYWDLSGAVLQEFREKVQGNTLHWAAGFYKAGDAYSISHGTVACRNLEEALQQTACTHQDRRYEQIAGDMSVHRVLCGSCGLLIGQEAHGQNGGLCSLCGYRFYVNGTCVYVLNGREERESYQELPGNRLEAKSFTGYRKPEAQTVPENGGELRFVYEPIQYRLEVREGEVYELRYDDSLFLPALEKKGCRQEAYVVL